MWLAVTRVLLLTILLVSTALVYVARVLVPAGDMAKAGKSSPEIWSGIAGQLNVSVFAPGHIPAGFRAPSYYRAEGNRDPIDKLPSNPMVNAAGRSAEVYYESQAGGIWFRVNVAGNLGDVQTKPVEVAGYKGGMQVIERPNEGFAPKIIVTWTVPVESLETGYAQYWIMSQGVPEVEILRVIRSLTSVGGGPAPEAETPSLLLDLPLGPEPDLPGATPDRVGGVSAKGPLSFAIGPGESIHLLDSARGRVLVYKGDLLQKSADLPFLGEEPNDLVLHGGRIYVHDGSGEYEVAGDGAIRRIGRPLDDGTIYPRLGHGAFLGRERGNRLLPPDSERAGLIGYDGEGNRYVSTEKANTGWTVRRLDQDGKETARAALPPGQIVEWYVTSEGGLYALTWTYAPQPDYLLRSAVARAAVYRVLAPIASAKETGSGGNAGFAAAEPPVAFGLPAPLSLDVWAPGWPPLEIRDPVFINNLWRLLGGMDPEPISDRLSRPGYTVGFGVTANLPGGAGHEILFYSSAGIKSKDRWYDGVGVGAAASLLGSAVFTPSRLAEAITSGPVAVTIPDLPGVTKELTPQERRQLAAGVARSFRAGLWEPPQPLEEPFPRYAVSIEAGGDEKVTVALAGDRHLYMQDRTVALAHPGDPARLVREWLPVPDARPGELAYLYRATSLSITQGGLTQDLTRWKATVVRTLLQVRDSGSDPAADDPFTLTFTVDGKPHIVEITGDGFSYSGKTYKRRGLLNLARLQGVP